MSDHRHVADVFFVIHDLTDLVNGKVHLMERLVIIVKPDRTLL